MDITFALALIIVGLIAGYAYGKSVAWKEAEEHMYKIILDHIDKIEKLK